jgi:hypothetical protein
MIPAGQKKDGTAKRQGIQPIQFFVQPTGFG